MQTADWIFAADVITNEQYADVIRKIFVERLDLDLSAFNHTIYDFLEDEEYYQLRHGVKEAADSDDIPLPLSSISSIQSQYDFIPTETVMNLVLPSASVSARNNGMGKFARFGHHNSARLDFFITLFFHALLGLLSLLWVRPTCSILKEKKKKSSKWVKMHGSRLFLALAAILILVSTPTCIKAESGGDAEAPLAEMPDALKTLTKLSRDIHLRGSDPEVTVATTKNILQKHLESIEALQRMYQNGDNDGLASVLETILSDKKTLKLAISQMKEISGEDPFGGEDVPLDSIVEEITRGDIEIDFVEAFRQSDFNSLVDDMKHISEILNNVDSSLFSHSHSHRRMANLFDQDGGSSSSSSNSSRRSHDTIFHKKQKSQFTTNTFSQYAKLFENTGNIFPVGSGRGKASYRPLPHFHRIWRGSADDRDRAARKLRVSDRNTRRRLAAEQCTAPCSIDDASCNCRRLYDCLNELSTYDLAVLTLRGYIVLDGIGIGDITNDSVDVFDLGDGGLTKRFDFFKGRASMADPEDQEQCTRVLEELHSSCSPTEFSCSDTNNQAYQLSVDEVCDAVDTNVKLNLETIFDVFSTKPICLKITTSTTPCLEVDPSDGYHIKAATCDATNTYQQFYMTHEGLVKVKAEPSKCLDQRVDGTNELYMFDCHGRNNQLWTYDSETESLRSAHDGACVDYNFVSNHLTHLSCHGQNNQKFSPIGHEPGPFLPSKWNSNGYLKAYVDSGYGYELVADSSFHYGEVVLDNCYPAILGVKVSQGDQTGSTWIGNLEVSNDDMENFLPMKCIGGCTCDEMEGCSPLMPVAVDGDFDAMNGVANVYCLGTIDRNCTFAPDLAVEKNSKESTQMPYDRFMI